MGMLGCSEILGSGGHPIEGGWKKAIRGKVLGVDVSILLHSLLGLPRSMIHRMLSVNPDS